MTLASGGRRRIAAAIVLLAISLLGWQLVGHTGPPAVSFVLTDGRQLSLQALHGRPLLISFWASDCAPCLQEMPALGELYRELAPQGLALIGVAMPHDPPSRVLDVQRRLAPPYPLAFDLEAQVVKAFGNIRVTPTHILLAPSGEVVFKHTGMLDMAHTRDTIRTLLASG